MSCGHPAGVPVIIKLKTKLVAVYLETHCNTGSNTACCPLTRQVTQLFTYLHATSHSVPRPHRFVYFFVMTQHNVDAAAIAEICIFSWAYSPQTGRPPPKLNHERHILEMSTSPRNGSHYPKLCRLSCTPITNTPRKYPFSVVLGHVEPMRRNSEIFQRSTHAHTDSRLLFQKCPKSVQDKCPKVGVVLVTEKNKTRFGILRWNHRGDFR